jgi:hypothetical protein
MCEKCDELDKRIARIRALAARITDEMTLQGIADIVAEHLAQKLALHSEPTKKVTP